MLATVAGTIRRTSSTTWQILSDTDHEPIGVSSVEILSSPWRLRLHYDFTATKVHTIAVTPDETFAAYWGGFRVGASVGLAYMDIYTYENATGNVPVNPGLWSAAGANLWVYGLFRVEESA